MQGSSETVERQVQHFKVQWNVARARTATLRKKNAANSRKISNLVVTLKRKKENDLVSRRKLAKNYERELDKADKVKESYTMQKLKVQQLQEQLLQLEEENVALNEELSNIRNEEVVIRTQEGRSYTNEIRALYYRLLAENIPSVKLEKLIKIVLNTFVPTIDTKQLSLPKSSLAATLRSDEMPTISAGHTKLAYCPSQILIISIVMVQP